MRETTASTTTLDGEEASFIIDYARRCGWSISRAQLVRRHRAGVIGRPRQEARGRGQGSMTVYPTGTAALLVEGLEFGGIRMPLRQLSFELWLRGRPVPMLEVRRYFAALTALHDRVATVIRTFGFGQAALAGRALRFIERIARAHAPAAMGAMRRRLGSAERVEALTRVTLEAAGGVYQPPERVFGQTDDEGWLVELALGLRKARLEAPVGAQPWLQGSASEALVMSSKLYAGDWSRELAEMSDADLERGREKWVQFREFFDVIRDMREMYGDDVFGFGGLADGYAFARGLIDPLAVFVLARDARGANILGDKAALKDVCAQWRRQVSPQLRVLRALRAFPPTAELAAPRRLRQTVVDAKARMRWEAEAREVGELYRSDIAMMLATD